MEITEEDKMLFRQACDKIIGETHLRQGIGTLREKTVHAVLKYYLVPKEEYHEIPCAGFVADILFEGEIIEIQTANFDKLRKKLAVFLEQYEVTIVYPIPAQKWVMWINEETGEITPKRKSPKRGTYYHAFKELYKIKPYLTHKRLHLRLLLLDMEEYRLLNGWSEDKKRGSVRFERIPIALQGDITIALPSDYRMFVRRCFLFRLPRRTISVLPS
ncbi:MAG: hypothetical protein RR238_03210 [Lachnospiraceae bacterium]